MLLRLFIAALWSPTGKGLTFWLLFLMFIYVFFTFSCSILSQVWHLIVSFPDLCLLFYFYIHFGVPKDAQLFSHGVPEMLLESKT